MSKIFVSQDSAAVALGADDVANTLAALTPNSDVTLVRNGSRGMFWLEPMVEVETENGRVAYGPVTEDDVPSLIEQGMLDGEQDHPLSLGLTEEIPFFKKQTRLVFQRCGITDPLSLDDYKSNDGLKGT